MEKAKALLNEFCREHYGHDIDNFEENAYCVSLMVSFTTDEELPFQVDVDLVQCSLNRYIENVLVECRKYRSLKEFIDCQLEFLSFDDLASFTDEQLAIYREVKG